MPRKIKVNKGDKYNYLTIIQDLGSRRLGKKMYRFMGCICDCGKYTEVQLGSIRSGHTKSCGCLEKQVNLQKSTTHNMSNSRIYNIWRGIKNRCDNKSIRKVYNTISYDYKWSTFEGFYEDMKDGYSDNLSIDRIDNNKGYYKKNCRWATITTQNRNHSRNRNLTYKGKTMCITDWAKHLNVTIDKINWHIKLKKNPISFKDFIETFTVVGS